MAQSQSQIPKYPNQTEYSIGSKSMDKFGIWGKEPDGIRRDIFTRFIHKYEILRASYYYLYMRICVYVKGNQDQNLSDCLHCIFCVLLGRRKLNLHFKSSNQTKYFLLFYFLGFQELFDICLKVFRILFRKTRKNSHGSFRVSLSLT